MNGFPGIGLRNSIILALSAILLLLRVPEVMAQQKLILHAKTETRATLLTSDALGHFYLIDANVFSKYSADGVFLRSYSSIRDGSLSWADASDPLKILVFHRDFSLIRYLNDELAAQQDEVSLLFLGIQDPALVCTSFDNAFWVFDAATRQLMRYDSRLKRVQESGDIAQLTGSDIDPVMIYEHNHTLFMNDPDEGILLFDRYAAYLSTLPIQNIRWFQPYGDQLFFLKDGVISAYNMTDKSFTEILQPGNDALAFRIENKRLFVLLRGILEIYRPE